MFQVFRKVHCSNGPQLYRCFYLTPVSNVTKAGPEFLMEEKIRNGNLQVDPKQREVIRSLQQLYENIKNYSPSVTTKYFHKSSPKGIYIYGSVGAGKTTLMDVFYNSVQTVAKRRVHFNDFMADVHGRVHSMKKKGKTSKTDSEKIRPSNPFKPVARSLIKKSWLLCFDEFQVTDIGDAMILKSLFKELFDNGMVMVATSNRSPDDLYKNGLQRSNFLPFIGILKKHCMVVSLNSADYRKKSTFGIGSRYFVGGEGDSKMDHVFKLLCNNEKKITTSKSLRILGRNVTFRKCCGRILDVNFSDLCVKPLGPSDYLQIAKNFDIVLIRNVPKMNMEKRNELRRFILLIDTFYDKKVKIVVSAEASPQNLFSATVTGPSVSDRDLMDDLDIESDSENAKSSIFSGSEEIFAFDRTISRLIEMSSEKYWKVNGRSRE